MIGWTWASCCGWDVGSFVEDYRIGSSSIVPLISVRFEIPYRIVLNSAYSVGRPLVTQFTMKSTVLVLCMGRAKLLEWRDSVSINRVTVRIYPTIRRG